MSHSQLATEEILKLRAERDALNAKLGEISAERDVYFERLQGVTENRATAEAERDALSNTVQETAWRLMQVEAERDALAGLLKRWTETILADQDTNSFALPLLEETKASLLPK